MKGMLRLGEKVHCRFGEKGDTGMFILIPYEARDFDLIVQCVTPQRVGQYMGGLQPDQIKCFPCPQLGAMVVVIQHSLRGGVTSSLALDAHGKTRSGYLLGMYIPWGHPAEKSGVA